MEKKWKAGLQGFLAAGAMVLLFPVCADAKGQTVILYTNDVHCAIDGYSKLAAYRAQLEEQGDQVIVVDAGDAIQGETIGTLTQGEAITDLMNTAGYDYAVPGNHEFDYGLDTFLSLAQNNAQYEYLSSNFLDLRSGELVFAPYEIVEVSGQEIAFVGIATPETYTKSTPAYFQDENGNFIYSFEEDRLYEAVQSAVDSAREEGADLVIVVGHLGIEGITAGWRSTDVIANTDGIDAFIDGHAHETIPGTVYQNKEQEEVPLSSTGTKFANFGVMTILDGEISTELVSPDSVNVEASEASKAAYQEVQDKIDGYNEEMSYLNEKLGTSETELTVDDPQSGQRRIRSGETNMGDFVADAYREVTGADISLVNGGGIRASIGAGDVTRKSLMDINPWNNPMCVIEATGQQIVDSLENGARLNPEECGGFLQVSGLTYEIHAWRESPVITDDKGSFQSVDPSGERRVENVRINGQPIDLSATYTVAGSVYLLQEGGDGNTMFQGAKVVAQDGMLADAEMLIRYFTENLGGTVTAERYGNPYGDGRIQIYTEEQKDPETPGEDPGTQNPDIQNPNTQGPGDGDDEIRNPGTQNGNTNTAAAVKAEKSSRSPKTGDDSSALLPVIGMAAALICVIAIVIYRKIKKR